MDTSPSAVLRIAYQSRGNKLLLHALLDALQVFDRAEKIS